MSREGSRVAEARMRSLNDLSDGLVSQEELMRVILYTDLRTLPLAEWRGYVEGVSEYLRAWELNSMPDTDTAPLKEKLVHANSGG